MTFWKYGFYFRVTKNKSVEIECLKDIYSWFTFHIAWTTKTDHAGLNIDLCLFRLGISFKFYDNRHWDYDKNDWSK